MLSTVIVLLNTSCITQTKERVGGALGAALEMIEHVLGKVLVMDVHSVLE